LIYLSLFVFVQALYTYNNPNVFTDSNGLKVAYGVHSVGATVIVAEGSIGFAYAESECKNGKKYVAIYAVGAAGLNVGLELKLGKLFELIAKISKLTANASSLLEGDSFTLEGDIPESYISYLDVGAFQGGLFYTGSVVDIKVGPYEGGRKIDDPILNHGLTGNVGVSLAKATGFHLKRVHMYEKECCK
jgi:hypothetical protein